MTAAKIVSKDVAPTPGDVRALGAGDSVTVYRDAAERHDWAPLANAVMIAFVRGARVEMVDDSTRYGES